MGRVSVGIVPQERETAETDQFSLLAPPRIGVRACVRTQS